MNISVIDALRQVITIIKNWVDNNKVQKINGKGLSTNDYTTEDKNKVANMPNDLIILNGELYLAHDGIVVPNSAVALLNGDGSAASSVFSVATTIDIPYDNWFEVTPNEKYSQYVNVDILTENTKVDLNPTADQLVSLQLSETMMTAENDGTGAIKIWAIGGKPICDYSMKVYLTEVAIV